MIQIETKYDLADLEIAECPSVETYYKMMGAIILLTTERKYDEAGEKLKHAQDLCEKLKAKAVKADDEKTANILFLLGRYAALLGSIASFWRQCDKLNYPTAWNSLQDGLSILRLLEKLVSKGESLPVSINELGKYLRNIEKIYPYNVFMSIGTLNKKEVCSICKRSPFDQSCVHITGNLYMGKIAHIIVEEAELLEVSIVSNPADKRCIVFLDYDKGDIEKSQFWAIHRLIINLKVPYQFFHINWIRRSKRFEYKDPVR